MEFEIQRLKTEFINLKDIIGKIIDTKTVIKEKLSRLKEIHADFIKDNKTKKIFLICLESFHFQYKVMNVETDNMHRSFALLMNRAYCDYFNLYSMLHKVFQEYEIDVPTSQQHPAYKDLEPFFEYKMEDISLAHENSIDLITILILKYKEKESLVSKYISKSKSGIRIANFINTLEYENKVLKEKIELFTNYCDFFQNSQLKYFNKLYSKIQILQDEINNEITFHETPWDNTSIKESDTLMQVSDELPVAQWDTETCREGETHHVEDVIGISGVDLEKSEVEQQIKHVNKKNNKHKDR
jgi:hypothetical protein